MAHYARPSSAQLSSALRRGLCTYPYFLGAEPEEAEHNALPTKRSLRPFSDLRATPNIAAGYCGSMVILRGRP